MCAFSFQMNWTIFILWSGLEVDSYNCVYDVHVGTSFKKFK